MQRTTLSLPDDLAAALKREAQRRRTSVSDVARQAIVDHLGFRPGERRQVPFAALGRSGGAEDIGGNVEEILAREWPDWLDPGDS
ncbi:MAG: hypothetical protein QOE65_1522 [Solirubrobacteraceae bacterium]|jgi:predicted transcriptional regulator|nr:hypothetical protein [Solirubrobacteraceae bacterium]